MTLEINNFKEYFLVHRIGCPTCHAKSGEFCRQNGIYGGTYLAEPHQLRIVKALEEE